MTSKYLKCDKCGKTLGAEAVIKFRNPTQGDTAELVKAARALGWEVGPSENRWPHGGHDLCPTCKPVGSAEGGV